MSERVEPSRLEHERAILGACYLRPNCVGEAMTSLVPGDFLAMAHRGIWQAMVDLWLREQPLEPAIVAERASAIIGAEPLAVLGGADYIAMLPNDCIVFESVGYHVRKVRAAGHRYRWALAFARLAQRARDKAESDDEYLDGVGGELVALMLEAATAPKSEYARKPLLKATIDSIEAAYSTRGKGMTGVATGIEEIDTVARGLQPGQLAILAARPGVGKSAMMGQVVETAATAGAPVLVFSLEMTAVELSKRALASEAGVDSQRISTGDLETKHWAAITSAASRMSTRDVTVVDVSALTIAEIRAVAKRWRIAHPQERALVAVDYLQIVRPSAKQENRMLQVAEVSLGLKNLAKDLKLPVLALAQLNRKLEERANKRPGMGDLRESGSIEQDADIILFLHREEVFSGKAEDAGKAELICAKNRGGPTFATELTWQAQFTRFVPAAPDYRRD